MPTYIPNAAELTEPVESRTVESAALEFRTLKTDHARTLKFPAGESSSSQADLPAVADRAGKFLYFNSVTGKPEPVAGTPPTSAEIEDGSVTTAKLASDAVTTTNILDWAVTAAKLAAGAAVSNIGLGGVTPGLLANGGYELGMRNRIINGKMEIAQRGSAQLPWGANTYGIDRWVYVVATTTAVINAAQHTDAPSSQEFRLSLRTEVTTADTSIAAGNVAAISQRIEGFNVRDLIGRNFTLSFWVRSSKTGVHCVWFKNSGNDRSYVAEYTISAANTWEQKSITVSGGLITTGTWSWVEGVGLQVGWTLAAGSTFQATAGAWQTGNFVSTANQVNCLDTIGNIFAITGVQLEVGSVATPFEHRPYGAELALCQRYYLRYTNTGSGTLLGAGQCGSAASGASYVQPPVEMRSTPTFAVSSLSVVGVQDAGGNVRTGTSVSIIVGTKKMFVAIVNGASGLVAGNATAIATNAAGWAEFLAEL